MHQPLIGITAGTIVYPDGTRRLGTYAPNATAIAKAGGLPVIISADLDESTLHALYERLDGFLIPGGDDVNPERYGAKRHPLTQKSNDERDWTEITITRWAVEDNRPLLGVCRGAQLVNVAMGGTLIQDIPSLVEGALTHDYPRTVPRSYLAHKVSLQAGTCLANIIGQPEVVVNSLHHQAVDRVAPGFIATACASDNVIEAIEMPDKRFILAVQWHPEDLINDERMLGLFRALIETTYTIKSS